MKINFKNICIIFLVALLGAFGGVLGANELSLRLHPEKQSSEVINNVVTKEESKMKDAIKESYDTVVRINISAQKEGYFNQTETISASGSGVIISDDGYIVTNHHVIEGANNVNVYTSDDKEYKAQIIGSDAKTDLALLKIDAKDLNYAKIADSSAVEIGDDVYAIGNPLGNGISVTSGIISALHKQVTIKNEAMTLLQTNAEINSGNSGGGLFNLNGELIGIVNAKTSSNIYSQTTVEGLGYAIPSNTMTKIINSIKENGYVKDRPTLGVKVAQVGENNQGLKPGLYISEVYDGGAAAKANLVKLDRIIEFNGVEISSYQELSAELAKLSINDTVSITVVRDGKLVQTEITLQENQLYEE